MSRVGGIGLAVSAALLLTGCDSSATEPCDELVFEDPVVTVVDAVDAVDGTTIPVISLVDITLDDRSVEPGELLGEASFGVTVDEGALVCDVACGFGEEEGVYAFRVTAEGFEPLEAQFGAAFESVGPGCPSTRADGTRISVTLTPTGSAASRSP